jgi:hypothetical protein
MSIEPVGQTTQELPEPEGLDQDLLNLGDYPLDSLLIRPEHRTAFEIARRIDAKQYIMDPDFQRDFIWDIERQSRLIESAILRIPLPVFYLAETTDGKIVVVDGLQRLTTFHRYLNDEFALKYLKLATKLNGQKFSDLPPVLKNRIEDTQLTLYLIDPKVPEQAKFDIFERVNSGLPLTRQQMRNCLFVGDATRWLGKMSKDEDFLKATDRSLNWRTMRDRECINRFAGFHLIGYENYGGKMEDFLDETLRKMNKELSTDKYLPITELFKRSMHNNYAVFGRNTFRKSISQTWNRSVINIALFDVLSVFFTRYAESQVESRKEQIIEGLRELIGNPTFLDAISRSTNSKANVVARFQMVNEKLSPILQ